VMKGGRVYDPARIEHALGMTARSPALKNQEAPSR
jgi:hypothetical protein